jgi:L-amino acid N-acyltransferase YncA
MKTIYIREMGANDYIGVRSVDELTQKQYRGAAWDNLSEAEKDIHLKSRRSEFDLNLNTGYCFVGVADEEVVGFILAHETLPFRGGIYIRHIAVHPDYQSIGIGSKLYQALIGKAKATGIQKITALINLDNPNSIRLHEKMNFELIDRKQAFLKFDTLP